MDIEVVEESVAVLPDYGSIPIAFLVESQLRVESISDGFGGLRLVEEKVKVPYIKDFDKVRGEGPTRWLKRWNIVHWGVLSAFDGPHRIGGAVIAWQTPGVNMLEGRNDLAVLWDIRVHPECRRQGIGSKLFSQAVNWACEKE